MESSFRELIDEKLINNPKLKKLYLRHKKLEREVERFEQYARYSSAAAIRHKELKKQKLKWKEEIFSILTDVYSTNISTAPVR
jgi:uncharacterized protein YdcH (DUF465 family)